MRLICIVLLATLAPAGWAADVYRCKGRSGETVYSEHPCDGNAQPMKLRDNRPASTEAATGEASEPGEGADPDNGIEQARENQRACAASATAAIYGPSNDRIAGHQHQLLALRQQLDAGGSSVAADQGSALRAKIAALRQAITTEHAAAHSQIEAARQRCQQQYRREPARS